MSALLAAALAWPPPLRSRAESKERSAGRRQAAQPVAPASFAWPRAGSRTVRRLRTRGRGGGWPHNSRPASRVRGGPRCLCAVCPGAPLQRCCRHCFGYLPRCAPPMPCRCRCRWRAGTKKGSTCKAGDIWDGVPTCAARVSRSVGQGSGGRPERPIPCHCDCPYLYIPASIATQTSSALFPLPLAV